MYILLPILFIVIFLSRVIYHALIKFSGDFAFHLLVIREIRARGHRIPERISAYISEGIFGYHCGVHWLLSFVKERYERYVNIFYGPVVESMHALVLFLLIYKGLGSAKGDDPAVFAFFTAFLAMFSPILNKADGRGYSINGRSAGALFFNVSFVSLIIYTTRTPEPRWLFVSILSTALLLLTSQFAFQAALFFSVLIFIATGAYKFILILALGMICAEIISLGAYHRFFRINSINHKVLLFKYRNRYEVINRFNSIGAVLAGLKEIFSRPAKSLEGVYRNSLLNGLIHLPTVAILVAGPLYPPNRLLWAWGLAGLITMFFIYIPLLRFLGEPHRYLEYVTFPCAYLFMSHFPEIGLFHLILFSWFLIIQLLNYYGIWASPYSAKKKLEEKKAIEYLKKMRPGNLLAIPTFMGIKIALYSSHRVLEFAGIIGSTEECNRDFFFVYPEEIDYPNRNLAGLVERFNIDYIVLDLSRLLLSKRANDYDLRGFTKVFRNDAVEVYTVKG